MDPDYADLLKRITAALHGCAAALGRGDYGRTAESVAELEARLRRLRRLAAELAG